MILSRVTEDRPCEVRQPAYARCQILRVTPKDKLMQRPGVVCRAFFTRFCRKQERKTKMARKLFTSESVTEGHPDKICDQISDAILDAILAKEADLEAKGYVDPTGQPADVAAVRCACETMAATGMVMVSGEIRTNAYVDVDDIVRDVVRSVGYALSLIHI